MQAKKTQTPKTAAKPAVKSAVKAKPAAKPSAPAKKAAKPSPAPAKAAPAKVAPAKKALAKPQAVKSSPAKKAVVAKPAAPKAPAAQKTTKAKAAPAKAPTKAVGGAVEVVFERYSPQSHSVDLVGTFNNWKLGKNPLRRDESGKWTTVVKLKPGSYEYKFVYDGLHYEPDPERELIANSFGSANNLLIVA